MIRRRQIVSCLQICRWGQATMYHWHICHWFLTFVLAACETLPTTKSCHAFIVFSDWVTQHKLLSEQDISNLVIVLASMQSHSMRTTTRWCAFRMEIVFYCASGIYRPLVILAYRPFVILAYRPLVILAYRPLVILAYRPLVILAYRPLVILAYRPFVILAYRPLVIPVKLVRSVNGGICCGTYSKRIPMLHVTFRIYSRTGLFLCETISGIFKAKQKSWFWGYLHKTDNKKLTMCN